MANQTDQSMLKLASLRDNLKAMMDPELLEKFAELLEELNGHEDGGASLVERYRYFVTKNGHECRYANMAKEFFLADNAIVCAEMINDIYHSWSKNYE